MQGPLAWWRKRTQRKNGATTFMCPEETEQVQRDIDDARKKSEVAQDQAVKAETMFGLSLDALAKQAGEDAA